MLAARIKERDLPEKVDGRSSRVDQADPVGPTRFPLATDAFNVGEPLISSQPVTEKHIVVAPVPNDSIPHIPAYRPRLTVDEREFLSYVARAYWIYPADVASSAMRIDDLNVSSLIGELFCGVRVLAVAHVDAQPDRLEYETAASTGHCVTLVLEAPYGDRAEAIYLSRFGPIFQVFNGSKFVLHQIIPQVNPASRLV